MLSSPTRSRSESSRWGSAAALLVALPALLPALLPGWYEGHDNLHIYRLIEYDLALRDGQIPPRWFPDVSAGYGNPHPLYYAPLFYLTAELFHVAGLEVIGALKGAIVVFMLLAALSMYCYARAVWGEPAAVVAAAAYSYAPYHLLDLYVRKALSEFTVFAFLPALLLAFHRLHARARRSDVVLGALATAAASTSHTITTMMVPPLLAAYAAALSAPRAPARAWSWRWMARAALAVGIGCALAAFFLVPALLERGEIDLRIYTGAYLDYHKHFVHPQQLVWSPWGFGMSLEGLGDQMSFRIGLAQIAGTLAAALALALGRLGRLPGERTRHALFFLIVTALSAFMTTPASAAIWDRIPALRFVQFPWRFLMLTTLATAFLCGAAFSAWIPAALDGSRPAARRRARAASLACAAALAAGAGLGGALGVHWRVPSARVGFEEKPFHAMIDRGPQPEPVRLDGAFVRRNTLRWIDHLPPGAGSVWLDESDLWRPKVEVQRGRARVEEIDSCSSRVAFRVAADATARLRVNVYRFPGWTVRVDGVDTPLLEEPRERRVLFFDVPPGEHRVEVTFGSTPPRRLGDGLTLAGLACLGAVWLWPAGRRSRGRLRGDASPHGERGMEPGPGTREGR